MKSELTYWLVGSGVKWRILVVGKTGVGMGLRRDERGRAWMILKENV